MVAEGWGMTGDPFDVVLVGDAVGEMAAAVSLAGGRVVARLGWGTALPQGDALIALDTGGAGEGPLAALAEHAARADVVACDLDQLDVVADAVFLTDAELLCAPTLAERIAALSIAAARAAAPERDHVRDGATERLRRFSTEVGRIAETLARLAVTEGTATLADRRPAYDAGPPVPETAAEAVVDASAVRRLIRARRLRDQYLGDGLFEDPAWDMLLDLFAAELEGNVVSVSSLCIAAAVAPTTALRWVNRLIEAGLFERRPDPGDRRRAFIALSARGAAGMRGYFAAVGGSA